MQRFPPRQATLRPTSAIGLVPSFWLISSICPSHSEFLLLNLVPQISTGIPDGLIGLHVAFFVGSANRHGVIPGCLRRPPRFPGPERIRSVVLAHLRLTPAFRAILRNLHLHDFPIAAKSNSAERNAHACWHF